MTKIKLPKTIAKRLADVTLRRLALEDQIKRLQREEADLKRLGAERFAATDTAQVELEGVGKVTLKTQPTATVQDWEKVFRYAAEHPESGVVHKRVSATAVEKLGFEGRHVDGVVLGHRKVLDVNVRAARKRLKEEGKR